MSEFSEPAIGSAEDAQPHQFLDTLSYVRVPGDETAGRWCVVEMHLREGHAPPMHVHESADETIHVLDGRIDFHTSDGKQTVGPNTSVVLPRGEEHSLVVRERATVLVSASPAGFDEFVTAVGEPTADESVPDEPPTEEAIGRVTELAGDYGIKIVGPPPVDS